MSSRSHSLTVVVVYPDLLGTYGDGGNGLILARRAAWRGFETELLQAPSDRPLPAADIYCIGGGEDGPQVRAAESLLADGTILSAAQTGAVVLGVCAGYQILGHHFPDSADQPHPGLGLLDVSTRKGSGSRAVGELMAVTGTDAPRLADHRALPRLTGFENHGGVTSLGPHARPLARVVRGVGNGGGDGTEGAWSGRVIGSYLHGPLLARNTALADLLLGWALAPSRQLQAGAGPVDPVALAELDDHDELALRAERLAAAERSVDSGWRSRLRSRRH